MTLLERLKKNPWFTNKKFPLLYLPAVIIPINIFIPDDSLHKCAGIIVLPFVFYLLYSVLSMLRVNIYIMNHRLTPVFGGLAMAIVSVTLMCILAIDLKFPLLGVIFLPAGALVTVVIYIYSRRISGARVTLLPFSLFALFLGMTAWLIITERLAEKAANALYILAAAVAVFLALLGLYFLDKKKYPPLPANMKTLEARFENYLYRVFRKLPNTEETATLREQLYGALIAYAEKNIDGGISEDALYWDAVDSLGNYSPLIAPIRRNIFTLIAGFPAKVVNFLFGFFAHVSVSVFYILSLSSGEWSDLVVIFAFVAAALPSVFCWLRIIHNIKKKDHKFTPAALGYALLFPAVLAVFVVYMTIKKDIVMFYGGLILVALILSSVAAQTAVLIKSRRNNGRQNKEVS